MEHARSAVKEDRPLVLQVQPTNQRGSNNRRYVTKLTSKGLQMGFQKGTEMTAELRRAESLELYLGGHSFRQVGEKLGVSHSTASKDVHKRLGQLVDADIREGLALRSLQAARYQRLLKAVWNQAVEGDDKAYAKALLVLNKLDSLFGLVKLAELTVTVDARSVNITDGQLAPDGSRARRRGARSSRGCAKRRWWARPWCRCCP